MRFITFLPLGLSESRRPSLFRGDRGERSGDLGTLGSRHRLRPPGWSRERAGPFKRAFRLRHRDNYEAPRANARSEHRPDRDRLALLFDQFKKAALAQPPPGYGVRVDDATRLLMLYQRNGEKMRRGNGRTGTDRSFSRAAHRRYARVAKPSQATVSSSGWRHRVIWYSALHPLCARRHAVPA
jgi:hypothetical protein